MNDYGIYLIFYIFMQLAPTDKVSTITTEAFPEVLVLQYDPNQKKWSANGKGRDDSQKKTISVNPAKQTISMEGDGFELATNDFISDTKINWKKVSKIDIKPRSQEDKQTPIMISRGKNSITLFQKEGLLARLKSIKLSW